TVFSGHAAGSVLLLASPDGPLAVRATVGPAADAEAAPLDAVRDLAEQALRERRPVGADAAPPANGEAAPTPSATCPPLGTPAGLPLGVLCLWGANHTPRVDAHDLDMLQLLAAQLAAAVESAQLHERLQQSLDALLAIHEAGRVLSASLEPEGIGRELLGM